MQLLKLIIMKKSTIYKNLLLTFVCLTLFGSLKTNAQVMSPNAIGIRLGDNDGFGSEISYQRLLDSKTRLELDLGWRNNSNYNALKLTGIHQWVSPIVKRLNWYVGAGASAGFYDDNGNTNNQLFISANGNLGIEYNFKIPLLLSFDLRPEISINNNYSNGIDVDSGFSLRYQF